MIRALLISAALVLTAPAVSADGTKPSFKKVPGVESSASRFKKVPTAIDTTGDAPVGRTDTVPAGVGVRNGAKETLSDRFKTFDKTREGAAATTGKSPVTRRKSPSEVLRERTEELAAKIAANNDAVYTEYLSAARNCLAMIEDGTAFNPGNLISRDPEIDLDKPNSKRRWLNPCRLFQLRVTVLGGSDGQTYRGCTMREGAGIKPETTRRIQQDLVKMVGDLVTSRRYGDGKYPFKTDKLGTELFFVVSRDDNARGHCITVTLRVNGKWIEFSTFENSDKVCTKVRTAEVRQ